MADDLIQPTQVASSQLAGTVRLGGTDINRDVLAGIHEASRKTGVSFAFMLAKAGRESSFRSDASNGASSAQGLYQFTRQTWLEQVKLHGADHGLGDLAAAIERQPDGRYAVEDPAARHEIFSLREDPAVSSAMAAEYAADNKSLLRHSLGRRVSDTDLYLAHFLGPGGAISFLRTMETRPDTAAAAILPQAAAANPTVFYNGAGEARSLTDIYALMQGTIDRSMRRYAGASQLPEFQGAQKIPAPPGVKPQAPTPEDMGAEDMGAGWAHRGIAAAASAGAESERTVADDTFGVPPESIAMARGPLPPGAKPAVPVRQWSPEDMGAGPEGTRMAGLPQPTALKPVAEDMGYNEDGTRAPRSLPPDPPVLLAGGEGSPAMDDGALARKIIAATDNPGLRRSMNLGAVALDAARAFAAMDPQFRPLGSPGNDTLSPPGLPSTTDQVGAVTIGSDADLVAQATRIAEETQGSVLASWAADDKAARAKGDNTDKGTTTYAVLAVTESFDPDLRLTSVQGRIPSLAGYPPGATGAPAPTPSPDDGQNRQAITPDDTPQGPDGTVLGWLRRMIG